MTLTRRQVVALLEDNGLHPSRALGQNFVAEPGTVRRIARLAGVGAGDRVVEIGAGLGSLTLALAETGASVTAVEIDGRLVPLLRQVVEGTGVDVVQADATALDWTQLLEGCGRWALVANLPYNVATPLVADLLDSVPAVTRMLVMVQREVAERLAAGPGDSAYGAVSVKVAYWAEARVVGRVAPGVFVPRPRVDSALVSIVRRPAPAVDPRSVSAEELFALVRAGFAQRRKMLRRSLSGLVTDEAWAGAAVSPQARAEELSVGDWGRLAAAAAGDPPPRRPGGPPGPGGPPDAGGPPGPGGPPGAGAPPGPGGPPGAGAPPDAGGPPGASHTRPAPPVALGQR